MGPIPFGYRASDSEDGCLKIAPEEAELVRGIFERIAMGGTLYSEAARLNDLGVRPPSWRYLSEKRSPAKHWSPPTIRTIVRNTTYSGTHKITLSTGEVVEQAVPPIVKPELQRQALARLEENRRFSGGRKTRQYLLSGLITCAVCGCSCVGRTNSARGKKYPYYRCSDDHALRLRRAPRGHAPYVRAEWLEETVWADVRQFLRDFGAVLERVRVQMESGGASAELEERRADLSKRLASKHKERDRWLHLYAQGHLSDAELERLLVERIMVGRDENRRTSVRTTYRFGPPKPPDEEDMFVNGVEYASRSLSANPGQPRGLAGRGRLSRSVAWPPRHRGRERGRAD